jgi:hypothetical protein
MQDTGSTEEHTDLPAIPESAFTRLINRIVDLADLDATWLSVATELLRFVAENLPAAPSWADLPPREPDATVVLISGVAREALAHIGSDVPAQGRLSFAAKPDRETLRCVAIGQLTQAPFDQSMNEAAVALGLAEAIDGLSGHTFMPWYKGDGELTVAAGTVYPIREHDPCPWLGEYSANTRKSHLPTRRLYSTTRLQVATTDISTYSFVLDFHHWEILCDLGVGDEGAGDELIAAVGQPNSDLDDFDVKLATHTYANRGPENHESQARLVRELVAASGELKADVLVLPEYGLATTSKELLTKKLSSIGNVPRLVVSGLSSGTDDEGYVINEAVMIITTADGASRMIDLPRKIHPAEVDGLTEQIRRGSEVRLFLTERWTIATLICFDAMDDGIIGQLVALGVNLLFVPALSAKTAAIIGSASSLSTRSQAFVVIATGPARWESTRLPIKSEPGQRWEAAFGGPYATGLVTETAGSDESALSLPRTNLWTFSYKTRTLREYAVDQSPGGALERDGTDSNS